MKQFERLVSKHKNWIYTFAVYSLGNHEEAQDATQEVLIKLWQHMDELKAETVPAWLRRVTQNACIDAVRRRRAYSARVVGGGQDDMIVHAVSGEPTPEAALEATELRGRIGDAVAGLDEPYRSIVILREIQQFKYEEISDVMELPLNTIKSYLHRARRMLREQLREAFE